jgi:uncharacterized protein involved in response to NO
LGYGLRFFIAMAQFVWSRTLTSVPKDVGFHAKLAWGSCWMIVMGFGAAIFPSYNVALLHIVFIGGFSLMAFAVAAMVILSHGGQAEHLKRPLWVLWVVAFALGFALLKRLMVIFYPDAFFRFAGMAAAAWVTGAIAWLIFVVPKLLRVPREDEFAAMHKEAKTVLLSKSKNYNLIWDEGRSIRIFF